MTSSHPARRDDDDFTFSTAAWVAIDVLALFVLVLMLWVFQPEKGILPEPSWLIDPLAGWLLGNVVGFAAYKAFLRMPPAGIDIPSIQHNKLPEIRNKRKAKIRNCT